MARRIAHDDVPGDGGDGGDGAVGGMTMAALPEQPLSVFFLLFLNSSEFVVVVVETRGTGAIIIIMHIRAPQASLPSEYYYSVVRASRASPLSRPGQLPRPRRRGARRDLLLLHLLPLGDRELEFDRRMGGDAVFCSKFLHDVPEDRRLDQRQRLCTSLLRRRLLIRDLPPEAKERACEHPPVGPTREEA